MGKIIAAAIGIAFMFVGVMALLFGVAALFAFPFEWAWNEAAPVMWSAAPRLDWWTSFCALVVVCIVGKFFSGSAQAKSESK